MAFFILIYISKRDCGLARHAVKHQEALSVILLAFPSAPTITFLNQLFKKIQFYLNLSAKPAGLHQHTVRDNKLVK